MQTFKRKKMKLNIVKLRNLAIVSVFLLSATSCLNDLDVKVDDDELYTSEQFYANPDSYKQFLAKIYAGLAVTGQTSPNGNSDLGLEADGGPNEGFSQYIRGYWQNYKSLQPMKPLLRGENLIIQGLEI